VPITLQDINKVRLELDDEVPDCILRWALHVIEDISYALGMSFTVSLTRKSFDDLEFKLDADFTAVSTQTLLTTIERTPGYSPLLPGVINSTYTNSHILLRFYTYTTWQALATNQELIPFAERRLQAELQPETDTQKTVFNLAEALASDLTLDEHKALMLLIPHSVSTCLERLRRATLQRESAQYRNLAVVARSAETMVQEETTWLSENFDSLQSVYEKIVPGSQEPPVFAVARSVLARTAQAAV